MLPSLALACGLRRRLGTDQSRKRVLLIDRGDPGTAGASFGNVGHIATEQLQPLPSPQLLLSFWRELGAFVARSTSLCGAPL